MTTVNLSAPTADLEVTSGVDWDLDIQWWQSDGTTPVDILSFEACIMLDFADNVALDLEPFTTILDNVLQIRVPAATTHNIFSGHYLWYVNATSTVGETKGLCRGKVKVRDG
jgi:hypothetical protein